MNPDAQTEMQLAYSELEVERSVPGNPWLGLDTENGITIARS